MSDHILLEGGKQLFFSFFFFLFGRTSRLEIKLLLNHGTVKVSILVLLYVHSN